MNRFFHSVYLNERLCTGCTNCIKRCPTQAIRVHQGKARIISKFCIDCGECVRNCPQHAKLIHQDKFYELRKKYRYLIALPSPSLYAQFNHLTDVNLVLTALIKLGFDDLYEISAGSEIISDATNRYIASHPEQWPLISTDCPSVVRLIQVRFPNLLDHLLPLMPPSELAATLAIKKAMEQTGLSREEIGVVSISPCPSRNTFIKSPLGLNRSQIDHVLAIKDIYPLLLPLMTEAEKAPMNLCQTGQLGLSWGGNGGECTHLTLESYLSVSGIEEVIHVLNDLEDEKLDDLQYIELDACSGGCVGGPLTIENPYMAQVKLKKLSRHLPLARNQITEEVLPYLYWTEPIQYEPVFQLGDNLKESITKLKDVDLLCAKFPGLDCGTCGAPTCRALAEDIVRQKAQETDCIYVLKKHIHELSCTYTKIMADSLDTEISSEACIRMFQNYMTQLADQIDLLDRNFKKEPNHDGI